MVPIAVGLGAGALVALVAFLTLAARRRRERALAQHVARRIEPYLRRKAAEVGLAADAPVWTSRDRPDQIVAYSARLADKLLELERSDSGRVSVENDPALGDTVPVASINDVPQPQRLADDIEPGRNTS